MRAGLRAERIPVMSVSDNSVVLRRFEASPGFFGIGPKFNAGRRYLYVYGFLALLVVPIVLIGVSNRGGHHRGRRGSSPIGAMAHRFEHLIPVVLGLAALGIVCYYLVHNRRKVVISVTGDGLVVNQRPGQVYSFVDARLGLWGYNDSTMGTALHLRCGAQFRARWTRSPHRCRNTDRRATRTRRGCEFVG
jgi:hypothetical protein